MISYLHPPTLCHSLHYLLLSQVFNNEDYLKKHFASVHHNIVRYLCADCPKVYTKRGIFISHVRTHHPQLKRSCDICYKWFPTAEDQNSHRTEHRDEKQHICVTCGKIFHMQSALMVSCESFSSNT